MIENKNIEYENTVVVGVVNKNQTEIVVKDYLDELSFLSNTAGGIVKKSFVQKLDTPNPKTFIGTGKISEIQLYNKKNDISSVIFDDELSPTQQVNLERILKCKIIDRTGLILDIFAQRAKTSYAKNQVQLAQYQYLMPRLKGLWTHLERQKGGIGMRGPGETEIETDRRIVRDKISLLKKKLKIVEANSLEDLKKNKKNILQIIKVSECKNYQAGKLSVKNAKYVIDNLDYAIDQTLNMDKVALVTGPILSLIHI